MSMRVDPTELRGAATSFNGFAGDIRGIAPVTASPTTSGMEWSDTAKALGPVDDTCKRALDVLANRMSSIEDLLNKSAADYRDTDTDAADKLKSLGGLAPEVK
ncbi:type VII secretion target [Gordonia jinhuaensis]|nr:type VII secretion target [Gordonia jinhuaensis]